MRYFQIQQDEHITDAPVVLDYHQANANRPNISRVAVPKHIADTMSLKMTRNEFVVYPDIILRPTFAVANHVREVFDLYNDYWDYKGMMLYQPELKQTYMYFRPSIPIIECLSDKTKYSNTGKTIFAPLVIRREPLRNEVLFTVAGTKETVTIIRLDFVESLLARGFRGFTLIETMIEQ